MSITSKGRLNTLVGQLDTVFSLAHPDDVPELIKALREDLSRRAAAARQPGYDGKHACRATARGNVAEEMLTALAVITALIVGVAFLSLALEALGI